MQFHNHALIGYSGFVGSTLLKQTTFDALYRSTNIAQIEYQTFNVVVCAGAPAQKWLANQKPEEDLQKIKSLIAHLQTIKCQTFILISTVDVFKTPVAVDENSPINVEGLHAYGLHRYRLEQFVSEHFSKSLIVRLPGLVGPGLRKNIIFDFLNHNNLNQVDSRHQFQFYPMVNLWYDIMQALQASLSLIHLTAAPISVGQVAQDGFGHAFEQHIAPQPVYYDMQTRHAALFGSHGQYQYTLRESLQAIRTYAQSEPLTQKARA